MTHSECHACPGLRAASHGTRAQVDAAAVEGLNPMFNDQFANVLKDALSRQGSASLFSGPIQSDPPPDKRCTAVPLRMGDPYILMPSTQHRARCLPGEAPPGLAQQQLH